MTSTTPITAHTSNSSMRVSPRGPPMAEPPGGAGNPCLGTRKWGADPSPRANAVSETGLPAPIDPETERPPRNSQFPAHRRRRAARDGSRELRNRGLESDREDQIVGVGEVVA